MSKVKARTLLTLAILTLLHVPFSPTLLAKTNPLQDHHSPEFRALHTTRYQDDAERIKKTFENELYTLNASTAGHYGLRMYRQTLDPKYSAAVWSDMARVASTLNGIAASIHTKEQAKEYGSKRLEEYRKKKTTRSQLRYQATKDKPEYLLIGLDMLGSMARANEYGLKHKADVQLRHLIKQFDFKPYATNPEMIRAWAAQLANQVYWLRQLGEQDIVDDFIHAFKNTYPDSQDKQLSDQQFTNKIYGLTHIIFAASEYYQQSVDPNEFAWIYDYFDNNIDQILTRTKEDVVAEVGISYLLANKLHSPVLADTQSTIAHAIDINHDMIPSTDGSFALQKGEHRNVLAIMLLNWQGVKNAPTVKNQPEVFKDRPYGLVNNNLMNNDLVTK
ncbi:MULTISPECIES: DUF3541 domain-containing protein [Vibrio]|uniref:DUF3541 domain-containing protein n=1 Tax=Vibrio casei TaxID=673372 RepID=A0A368LHR8_9VIBR|nr:MULTISPECIES: DUF3541 domain-containing protein [Vibrio]RCS70292.1 DUF3541 domain-containing protein [Vibrio casei]SJN19704.1 hypothetical protein FM109_02580 [Vibrio casei]HBV77377.1 DUF3541 domain-containing protein [Vibrio sp.]